MRCSVRNRRPCVGYLSVRSQIRSHRSHRSHRPGSGPDPQTEKMLWTFHSSKMATNTTDPLREKITEFYREYYHEAIAELAKDYPSDRRSLWIDCSDLFQFDPDLADDLRDTPRRVLDGLEEALRTYHLPTNPSFEKATVRVGNLPESQQYSVAEYRAENVGEYISVSGQVQKTTDVRPRPTVLVFDCARCGTLTRVPQTRGGAQTPHECQGCERQGPFNLDQEQSEFVNHQLIRIQEPPEQTKGGEGSHVDVHVEGMDLTGRVTAGDRVTVSGILRLDDEDVDDAVAFEPYIQGWDLDIEETDFEDIDIEDYEEEIQAIANEERGDLFELLRGSINPGIKGMGEVKEALALQLFGGLRKKRPGGDDVRPNSHILLLGDPGTAKSSLLRAIDQIAPRGVYASGKGASAAGMTAAATRDDFGSQQWTLEAGALVLANKGIACVDEIDKVDDEATDSLHTALEQEYVFVNKAGFNTHLPSKTALLAAGNPKHGRFDPYEPTGEQIDLDPALISRFDLMFMLDDEPEEDQDSRIISGMLTDHQTSARYTTDPESVSEEDLEEISPAIDTETLRAYVAYAKRNVDPVLTDEVLEDLHDWFLDIRLQYADTEDAPVPVTLRNLEAVIRLSEASARARLSDEVEMQDAERAKRLVKRSMKDVGMDPETGKFDADVVETGTSRSQRTRRKAIKQFIDEREQETGEPVPEDEIVEWVVDEYEVDALKAEHELRKLREKGEVYKPDTRAYRGT